MSEIMRPVPFPDLIRWIQGEYANHGSVFGIRKEKWYHPRQNDHPGGGGGFTFFEKRVGSPIGPAAGPHSQLAQNILAAYLGGARFMELKTVQTMDGAELRKCVARPCINAEDEGYNVEWSTELTVPEAQEEYIKAWFLCHIFAKEFGMGGWGDFIFNMSVGYSLDGIQSPKIDSYIEGMKNARDTGAWKCCYDYIAANIHLFNHFTTNDLEAITPAVSNSITLSTLHGCPREEIEKIAAYLITEKGMHTYIKCNPTLLGYAAARELLDAMGYTSIAFDDHHFKNDLQFDDAVSMLRRLKTLAAERGLAFGVKITNTFPVQITHNELPGSEMYMSGRSLFPLSINVAKKLSDAFNGELPISYSGGADYFNLNSILAAGIQPVTVATTILKPGGYERFCQLAQLAEKAPVVMAGGGAVINTGTLNALAESLPALNRYRKEYRRVHSRKTASALPLFDCFKAPCMDGGCPINQNIPEYLAAVAEENYDKAFAIIATDNTAPSITGTICDHQCQYKCARVDYEDPLKIRQAKLIAADKAQDSFSAALRKPELKTHKSVAIIGAGPAGIAAAVFLRRNGVPVTVYEKREQPFGIVRYVIPEFRIASNAIDRDFAMAQKLGVEFKFGVPATCSEAHDFTVIATGAWKAGAPVVRQGQEKVIDALRFLEDSKKTNCALELGKRVAVIGGGDVAMDCARAAKRNKGVEYAAVVYRRTREFMPSQYEEQELAIADGVALLELLAPETFIDGVLQCEVMRLGEFDSSGRRGIAGTGEKRELYFDTVIGAVGAGVDTAVFTGNGIALNAKGLPQLNAAGESSIPNVYVIGDCATGAATVVQAIAGGKAAAADILRKLGLEADFSTVPAAAVQAQCVDLYRKKGILRESAPDNTDAGRCLSCNTLCEICVDVCPNRANVMVKIGSSHQIVHIDRICNECGNCAVFCPHAGKPYKEKFTIFACEEDFINSENKGILKTGTDTWKLRLEDKSVVTQIPDSWAVMIAGIEADYSYLR